MDRQFLKRHANGTPFERQYGYCRAVRAGNLVFVAGTTAPDGSLDQGPRGQFSAACARVADALLAVGSELSHVVRTVVYVRSMADIEEIAAAHSAVFGADPPVSTVVEVTGLTPASALVEVEVTAVVPS